MASNTVTTSIAFDALLDGFNYLNDDGSRNTWYSSLTRQCFNPNLTQELTQESLSIKLSLTKLIASNGAVPFNDK